MAFYFYNSPIIGYSAHVSPKNIVPLIKWSFGYDAFVLLVINTPFLLILAILSFFERKRVAVFIVSFIFLLINFACIFLNLVDIFYYHFHLQRADADLLYVLQQPFDKAFFQNPGSTIIALVVTLLLLYILMLFHKKLLEQYHEGKRFVFVSLLMMAFCIILFISGKPRVIPTYPLTELNSAELQLVQNSFHTFLYSVYRKDEAIVQPYHFLSHTDAEKLMPLYPRTCNRNATLPQKNIVLFIMESIPRTFLMPAVNIKSGCLSLIQSWAKAFISAMLTVLATIPIKV